MDSFLTACGATGPVTLDITGPGQADAERRTFAQPFILIGRDDRAEVVLDHDLVSRRHAFLQVVGGRVFFVDLESRAGVVRGAGPADSGWLEPGEALEIGPFSIRLAPNPWGWETRDRDGDGEPAALPVNPLLARSMESSALPRVALEFQSRSAGHSLWRMSQVLALVGSSSRCKVRLFDSNVSKLHCALLRTAQGLWVVDLLGRGGITVNSVQTRFARLGVGDVLGLGQVIVRPTFEDASLAGGPGSGVWGGGGAGSMIPGAGLPERQTPRPWSAGGFPAAPLNPGFLPPARFATDRPSGTELNLAGGDPALAMLLNHFGQMQQQMLDQFQNSMMMMMQMFGGMHREQMGMVRDELNHLRELSLEIASLKAQMAVAPPKGTPSTFRMNPPTGGWAAPPPGLTPATPPQAANGQHPNPGTTPRPRLQSPAPPAGNSSPAASSGRAQALDPKTAPAQGQGGPQPPPPRIVKPPLAEPSPDVHDWLTDRLSAIEQEQQTRMQRIMSLLRGGSKP